MNKHLIWIVALLAILLPHLCGCAVVKNAGRELVEGGLEAAESKVIELHGEYAREHIANAMREGFAETDVDPNLDGIIEWGEYKAFQPKAQAYIVKDAVAGLASGKSIEEVKARAISLEESLGVSGAVAALIAAALNAYRNRTRRKDLAKTKAA